jgi:hypothetical protein
MKPDLLRMPAADKADTRARDPMSISGFPVRRPWEGRNNVGRT